MKIGHILGCSRVRSTREHPKMRGYTTAIPLIIPLWELIVI
jgi:hypothetical protein